MRISGYIVIALVVVSFGCKEQDKTLRAKELEVELARAKAAQAQAEAEKAKAELGGGRAAAPAPDPLAAMEQSERAEAAMKEAEAAAAQAVKDAAEAHARLDLVMRDLDAFDQRISQAVTAVADAQNDAERAAAAANLKALQLEQAELKKRVIEARDAAARAERRKGVRISKECLDNPLAKGCS